MMRPVFPRSRLSGLSPILKDGSTASRFLDGVVATSGRLRSDLAIEVSQLSGFTSPSALPKIYRQGGYFSRTTRNGSVPCWTSTGVRQRPTRMPATFPLPASHGSICAAIETISGISSGSTPMWRARETMSSTPSLGVGGFDFPVDPRVPADEASLFWMPDLQPEAILIQPTPPGEAGDVRPLQLSNLPGVDLRNAGDDWHAVWRHGGNDHQFWLKALPPRVCAGYVVVLPLDALFELRAHAARRFWRALAGLPPGGSLRPLPETTRQRHILMLRALDARLTGASYRTIAEAMFAFRSRTKRDWEIDPLKNRTRRLVADALRLMRGGYLHLLCHPVKRRRGPG